ncbi:riboflavin kinase [Malassezia cuniculi]|uniref:Riboflavin kinase n=1 Tax=Malassezia cuniculi TaxID=948313 RepID=A0AAF0J645_9BASI|nr:riboflavin kinase [Malassezia cuniculi]
MTQYDRSHRPSICGGDQPDAPFPVYLSGEVKRGFQRGSRELGCPTANLDPEDQSPEAATALENLGVYYGYARVDGADSGVYPMVMSVGWNPFYKNTHKTIEIHIMHAYSADFYGSQMRAIVLGYIRPELDYVSTEALIADIKTDIQVAQNSLARPAYSAYATNAFFT